MQKINKVAIIFTNSKSEKLTTTADEATIKLIKTTLINLQNSV